MIKGRYYRKIEKSQEKVSELHQSDTLQAKSLNSCKTKRLVLLVTLLTSHQHLTKEKLCKQSSVSIYLISD